MEQIIQSMHTVSTSFNIYSQYPLSLRCSYLSQRTFQVTRESLSLYRGGRRALSGIICIHHKPSSHNQTESARTYKTTKVKMLSFFPWSTLSRIKSTFSKDFIWQHNALVPFLDYMDRSQVGTNCFTLALRRPSPTLSCAYMHSSRFDTRFMATLPSYRRKNYSQQCQCQFQGICGVTQL